MDDSIIREELLDIYRNPMHKGVMKDPTVTSQENNPFCGDEINLQLLIKDGIIKDAKFNGSSCSVSVISSAMLTDALIGKTVEQAKKITKDDLLKMTGMNLTTSRIKCATLSLTAMLEALNKYESN
jgi:nitrogen fixation protein NifU and related proteins